MQGNLGMLGEATHSGGPGKESYQVHAIDPSKSLLNGNPIGDRDDKGADELIGGRGGHQGGGGRGGRVRKPDSPISRTLLIFAFFNTQGGHH